MTVPVENPAADHDGLVPFERTASIPSLPEGTYRWLRSDHPEAEVGAPDKGYLREDAGRHQTLAKILFKHNGYRPGPVRGWYVIVALDANRFAVGQMRADAFTPIQIFEDLVFPTEDEARLRAEQMRGNRPGARRHTINPSDRMPAESPQALRPSPESLPETAESQTISL
jgi:hypothetical protein